MTLRRGILALAVISCFASVGVRGQEIPPEVLAYPQIVLFNGKVLTVDQNFSVAQAVAVRDEKILAVGTTDRILKMAGPNTEKIDLQGRTVVPGFIDTHAHYGD